MLLAPAESPSRDRREDEVPGIELLENFDGFAGLRNALRMIAAQEEAWAGIPMPMEGHRMVLEPKFPRAAALAEIGISAKRRDEEAARAAELRERYGDAKLRNSFWSYFRKAEVLVFEDSDGKVRHCISHGTHPTTRAIETLDCSAAWGLEQEGRALKTLGGLLRHDQFKCYLLTGMFLERSKRSKLSYLFRKLKPTLAIDTSGDFVRIRCALCLHPIGYYEDTWAGVMTPTDDVIAHLMMMRGDEPMLWRRANQHPAYRPEAGL